MDYAEEQENELMMLESMYMEDFVKLDDEEAFEITIVPETGGDNNHVAAALKVKYSPTYPETPPVLHVRRVKGINEEQVTELEELVRLEAENEDLLGCAMVYMLAEKMQEWLQENNEPEAALLAAPAAVGKKAASYVDERCRLTGRQIFEEVDMSTFEGEEEDDEDDEEEDLMLQREAYSGGMMREEAGDAAAGEGELLDGVGDEALFDEDEDIPDE